MAKANNSNQWTLAGLFLCFAIPLFIGTVLYNDRYLGSPTNRGQFPPKQFHLHELVSNPTTYQKATPSPQWLIAVWQQTPCKERCVKHINNIRKLHILTRNEQTRIRTAYISNKTDHTALPPGMIHLSHGNTQEKWLKTNQRFIIDPRGNLVLAYPEQQSLEDTYKDLKRLLKYNKDASS